MDSRAVGIIDSGLGGLTALYELRRLLPGENIIYFADSGRMPYGERSAAQLKSMTRQDLDFVAALDVKAMLVACGTATTTSMDIIRDYPIRSFGVVEAAVQRLSRVPGEAPLGLIATRASVISGVYEQQLNRLCPGRELISLACPSFAPLIEAGHSSADDEELIAAVEAELRPLKDRGVSALLLGCTHYGIISQAITDYLGSGVELISASQCAAQELRDYITSSGLEGNEAREQYICSGSVQDFEAMAEQILGHRVHAEKSAVMEVEKI